MTARLLLAALAALSFPAMVRADEPSEAEKIIARLEKNLRTAEERLAKSDPGEGTQQIQRDIADDLRKLLEQAKGKEKSSQSQESQPGASLSRSGRTSEATRTAGQPSTPRAEQAASSRPNVPQPAQRAGIPENKTSTNKPQMSKIADLYKDVWGHLPETLRREMDQYSREQFMDKYGELIQQYYATIAEKSKRPGKGK